MRALLYDLLKRGVSICFNTLNVLLGGNLPPFGSAAVIAEEHDCYLVVELPRKRVVFPGGFMTWREGPKYTAQREAREETGLLVRVDHLIGTYFSANDSFMNMSTVCSVYAAEVIGGVLRNNIEGRPLWLSEEELRRSPAWRSTFWQFFRFCLVGGANTIIDLLMLNALLWRFPTNNVLVLVVYNSVAYSSGAVTSFLLNKYWTFGHKQGTTAREVVRFAIVLVLEILYSNGLLWLAGKALQPVIANPTLWGNASKLVAVAGSAVLSYVCMRFWTLAGRSQDRP